jgi:hypothetical protein
MTANEINGDQCRFIKNKQILITVLGNGNAERDCSDCKWPSLPRKHAIVTKK